MVRTLPLYTAVFVSGASVLALEILGTRVLGPFYGVSIFLWSALITVTLAALSVGYWVGGRRADAGAGVGSLAGAMALAGLWSIVLPWFRIPLLEATEPLGLRGSVLAASTLMFGPPLFLLGTVSPLAIKLKAQRMGEVGRTAGDLYALGTVASVVGALAVGFWLIPVLGVGLLLTVIGLLLLAAAAMLVAAARGSRPAAAAALLLAVGAVAAPATGLQPPVASTPDTLHLEQSAYSQVEVRQRGGLRYLVLDGGVHTTELAGTNLSTMPYVSALELFQLAFDEPGELLLLGLGGGSVAVDWAEAGWGVTAVEIDPVVADVAAGWFAYGEGEHGELVLMDARRFLRKDDRQFDCIILDAFGSSSIPFHLVTEEFFAELSRALRPDGLLLMNIEVIGWQDGLLASVAASVEPSLPVVQAFPTFEPPNVLGNVLIGASRRPMPWLDPAGLPHPQDTMGDDWLHWNTVRRHHAWDNRFDPRREGALVLTDDRNPVDLWSEEINREARRLLHEHFDGPKLGGRAGASAAPGS